MPYLNVRGHRFHYEEQGSGSVVLLISGMFGTGQSDFHHQIGDFSSEFQLIAPDLRGYGKSRPPSRDFPSDFQARDAHDMAALMLALGHNSFHLAGWSDGGNTALFLTLNYPKLVRKLIVWGANSFFGAQDMACLSKIRSLSDWSQRARAPLEAEYGEALPHLWNGYLKTMDNLFESGGEICQQRLAEIHCPVLVLHGDQDKLVPGIHAEVIAAGVRNSRLIRFASGGHNLHMKYAHEFNEVVRKFLLEH